MVDDGSTDRSAEIAQRYVDRDPRFRLVSQANGGLSKARNTGTDARGRRAARVPRQRRHAAAERLRAARRRARPHGLGLRDRQRAPAHALRDRRSRRSCARAFAETRLKTHVTRYRPLLADRPAWNKVWRRSFWDKHGFRFPEGRTYEDTPVTIPAHFLAKSVDVIADPCYLWRIREGGGPSITQRKTDPQALIDRLTSIQEVSEHLAADGPRGSKRWYDESVVADDLRYYLNSLDMADDEYRALFLDRVNAFLDGDERPHLQAAARDRAAQVALRPAPADARAAGGRALPEGGDLPARRRCGSAGAGTATTRSAPTERLKIPQSVYRLKGEFAMGAGLDGARAS